MVQAFLSDGSLMGSECCSTHWFRLAFQGLGFDALLRETYDLSIESFLVLSLSSLLCSHHPLSSPPLICFLVVEPASQHPSSNRLPQPDLLFIMSASDVGPGLSPSMLKANSNLSRCLLAPPLCLITSLSRQRRARRAPTGSSLSPNWSTR